MHSPQKQSKQGMRPAGANSEAPEGAREQHLLVEMALALLLSAINKSTRNKIDARDPDMLGMLGGLLPFLIRAMRSRHGTVASTALRVFSVLVPLPLPGKAGRSPFCHHRHLGDRQFSSHLAARAAK